MQRLALADMMAMQDGRMRLLGASETRYFLPTASHGFQSSYRIPHFLVVLSSSLTVTVDTRAEQRHSR